MRHITFSIAACVFRKNVKCQKCGQMKGYSTIKYNARGTLNSLISTIDKDFSNTENFQFFVSQEYDELFKSLNTLKGDKNVLDTVNPYSELRAKVPALFKTFVDKEFGGSGVDYTNFAHLLERIRSNTDLSYLMTVNQLLCAQAISNYGNQKQKYQYLTKLTSGESIGSFCLHELSSGNNIYMLEGFGEYCTLSDSFKISAKKDWIFNAQFMDMCIVFVKIKNENGADGITAFVKNDPLKEPGVHVSPCSNVLNIQNVGNVTFDGVTFCRDEILGDVGDGFKIALQLQNSARFAIAASMLGIIKDAFAGIFHLKLKSSEINAKMVKWSSNLFTIESALYFTTNIADDYPMSTFDSEFAALKVQASKYAFEVINGCIDLARLAGEDESFYVDLLDKIRGLELFLGSSDVLTYFIGGVSMQHNLPLISDDLSKLQNHRDHIWWKIKFSNVKRLPENYRNCAMEENEDAVINCLSFLRKEIIFALCEFGYNTPNQDSLQVRVGSCLISAYHLLAVIGHYKGLQESKVSYETKLLIKCSMDILREELIDTIGAGADRMSMYINNTKAKAISKIVTKSEGHGIESAITRNW